MADVEMPDAPAKTKKGGDASDGKKRFEVKKVRSRDGSYGMMWRLNYYSGMRSPYGHGTSS